MLLQDRHLSADIDHAVAHRSLECISVYTEITTLAVAPIALAAVSNAAKYSLDVNGSLMIHV